MISCAVILATGGNRYNSQVAGLRPRAMLPALGKPMVVHVMERLRTAGMTKLVIVMGDDDGALASYLNNFWLSGVEIEFVHKPLSRSFSQTLLNIAQKHPGPLLVTAYNIFTHPRSIDRLIRRYEGDARGPMLIAAPSTLTGAPVKIAAEIDDYCVMQFLEQAGGERADNIMYLGEMAICDDGFWHHIVDQQTFGSANDLIHMIMNYHQAGGIVSIAETSWLLPVHADPDLLTLNHHLLDQLGEAYILSEIPASVRVHAPVRIDTNVSIGQNAVIGPYVYLENGCKLGAACHVEYALILQSGVVETGEKVTKRIVG